MALERDIDELNGPDLKKCTRNAQEGTLEDPDPNY